MGLLLYTTSLLASIGLWYSFCTLAHCLSGGSSGQQETFSTLPHCSGAMGSETLALHWYNATLLGAPQAYSMINVKVE